jgi:polysaccharide transporter, PST family
MKITFKLFDRLRATSKPFSASKRKIIGNLVWLFADRFIQIGLALFVGLWVARYLGAKQFGSLNYAVSFVALFGVVVSLGMDSIVVRDVVRHPELKHQILGTAFSLKIIGGLVSIPLATGVNILFRPEEPIIQGLVAIVAFGGVFNAFNVISFWFQSQVEAKYSVVVRNASYIATCIIRIVLIIFGAPVIAFAIASASEMVIGGIGLVIAYQWKERDIQYWSRSFLRAKLLLKDSIPMMITSAVTLVYMRIDSVMIGQIMTDRDVGLYAAVMKLAEMWYFIPASIVSTVFPLVIKLKDVNEEIYYKRAQQLFTLMAGLSYMVAIPISLSSSYLMFLFYGQDYVDGGSVLAVYAWAGLFVSLGVARGPWMVAGDLLNFRAIAAGLGALTNVGLNWLLIPKWGIMGATVATIVSQCIASYLANAFHPKARQIFIRQTKGILLFGLPELIRDFLQKGKFV